VLDALVLDLHGERAVRANDLWLRPDNGSLVVAGADVSPWAVLRRVSRGRIGPRGAPRLLDWKSVEFLRGDPDAAARGRDYHRVVARLDPVTIARLSDALPYVHAAELLLLLPDPLAADAFEHLLPERQAQIIGELSPECAAGLLAETTPELAADALGQLTADDATRLLEAIPPDRATLIQDLLQYPPDTAGGIMTNEFVTVPLNLTIEQARECIRPHIRRPDFVYFVYVVDSPEWRRLRGVLTLRDLLMADPRAGVDKVMRTTVLTVAPLESALDVAHRVADYGLSAIPVVNTDGVLLGVVTVDMAMLQITPDTWRDRLPRVFS
jgi:Mg/Co/Ni transporter MgtE